MRTYKEYTDADVLETVPKVTSMAQLLKALGLRAAGGNYANMNRILQRLGADTSHWKGRAWNKGDKLKDWSDYSRAVNLKPHLITERGHKCEECANTKWLGKDIPLEIHHKDGDRTNNALDNLELLCPNCHALTDSWRRPNHSHNSNE